MIYFVAVILITVINNTAGASFLYAHNIYTRAMLRLHIHYIVDDNLNILIRNTQYAHTVDSSAGTSIITLIYT